MAFLNRGDLPGLLFHRGTAWAGAVRGSTNVLAARFLAAGYPVTWLGRPRHLGHALRDGGGWSTASVRHADGALEIVPFAPVPALKNARLPAPLRVASARLSYRSLGPVLRRAFSRAGQPLPGVVWTTGGDAGALRRLFPGARCIVQCVDVYEAYAGKSSIPLEMADYRAADAVVAIGHSLGGFLVEHRGVQADRLHVIGQGADNEAFAVTAPEPPGLAGLPRPRLIWVGVLDKADPGLMRAALDALPQGAGSLVLIGPDAGWVQALSADPRVRLLGPMHARDVVAHLAHCDIGLMLYRRDRNPLQYLGQNPLKLYEMAAAGLPILSTPHAEYAWSKPPIRIVEREGEIAGALAELIHNQAAHAATLRAFAQANDWSHRFDEARRLIRSLL